MGKQTWEDWHGIGDEQRTPSGPSPETVQVSGAIALAAELGSVDQHMTQSEPIPTEY